MGTRAGIEYEGKIYYSQFDGYPTGIAIRIAKGDTPEGLGLELIENFDDIGGQEYRYRFIGDSLEIYWINEDQARWELKFAGAISDFIELADTPMAIWQRPGYAASLWEF